MSKRTQFSMVTSIFFLWGFATCLNDILVPHLKQAFELDYFQSMLIQFVFFSAYLVVSIPAGKLIHRIGYPRGMVVGLLVAALGALLFIPASIVAVFPLFLGALAVLASGITILQVAANPYVAALGPAETSSVRLNLAQAFNSLGTTIAPWIGAALILATAVTSRAESLRAVRLPYAGLAGIFVVVAIVVKMSRLPQLSEDTLAGTGETGAGETSVGQFRRLVLGAVAIFTYVGGEVAVGSFMVSYLSQPHFMDWTPTKAAHLLSFYWGGAMVGRFLGSQILRFVSAGRMVGLHALIITALLALTMRQSVVVSAAAVVGVGLFNSILFPTIFTMSLKGLGRFTAEGSGILCCAIIGGAIIPPIQGWVADRAGLSLSFVVPLLCYTYIALFSWLVRDARAEGMPS